MAEPVIHFRQSVSGFLRLIRGQAREGQTTDANCDAGYNNPSPLSPSAQFRRRMRRIREYPPKQEPPMLHLRQRCGLAMGESGSDAANPMEKSHSRRWRIFPRLCPLRQSRSAAAKPSDAYGEGVFSAGGSSSVLPREFRRMSGARRRRTRRSAKRASQLAGNLTDASRTSQAVALAALAVGVVAAESPLAGVASQFPRHGGVTSAPGDARVIWIIMVGFL